MADPVRPMLIPSQKRGKTKVPGSIAPDQLVGYMWQESDDKKQAIVEYVVRDAAALTEIMTDKRARCFERGKGDTKAVETELRKTKAAFTLGAFGAIVR